MGPNQGTHEGQTHYSAGGQVQQQESQTQQKGAEPKGSPVSSTSRSATPGVPPGFDEIENQLGNRHLPPKSSLDVTKIPPSPEGSAVSDKQESVSGESHGRKGSGNQQESQDWREQKQSHKSVSSLSHSKVVEQRASADTVKLRPGLTRAQIIAAQASEEFDDEAKSTCSSRSSGSMRTARCTSSSTSMHTAYEGDPSIGRSSLSSQNQVKARQDCVPRIPRKDGQRAQNRASQDTCQVVIGQSSSTVPNQSNKQVKAFPKLPPRQLTADQNDSLLLAMSHIVHPNEFYIHPITSDIRKLDFLQEELKDQYENVYKNHDFSGFTPAVGMMGVSKYSLDQMWYRVQIMALKERNVPLETEQNLMGAQERGQNRVLFMAQVQFVDFGNTEWVPASGVKPLANVFFDLPAQAIKCSLAHIDPEKESRQSNYNDDSEVQADRGGWSQIAIDIFKQLAPCENHSLLGWMTKQITDANEAIPLILSYHEGAKEVCINQELVNLGLATSTRFQKQTVEATASPHSFPQSAGERDLIIAMQAWNLLQEDTGYGSDIVPALNDITRNKSQSQIPFILTVPPKTETESVTDRHLNMAMAAWEMKNLGYEDSGADDEINQAAAMDSWDPKTSDYFSERNSFEVDDEDVTAAVGYSHNLDRKFCKFYMRGQKCYRGDQCPFEHPQPGEDLRDRVPVFFAPTNHSPNLPKPDDWVAVEVTAIHTPFHFWVQLTWGKTTLDTIHGIGRLETPHEDEEGLHMLEKNINECCKVTSRSEDPNVLRALGEVVIAKFSRNKRWYRARIIDYDETEPCLKVFYVDYGNAEWVPKSSVRSPKPEFLHLPFQAVECFLYGISPVKEKEEITRRNFEPLVMDKTLVAHVISSSEATNTMELQLYNTNGRHDISVGQYLVQHNFANPIPDQSTDKSISVPSKRLRRHSELEEPDSVSCNEMQIPG